MPMLNTIWFIPAFIQAAALAAACAGPDAQSEARHAAPALSTLQQRCEHGASRADPRHDASRIEAAAGGEAWNGEAEQNAEDDNFLMPFFVERGLVHK